MSRLKDILIVAGARPNFMKIAPLWRELQKYPDTFHTRLIHTGQHYDVEMSDSFFHDLELPWPDRFLRVGSGSHAEQTAKVMMAFERVCIEEKPDLVVVVGDVNSTMACALTAKKLCIPVAHVEAGLRSFDRTMPEEINRVLTDTISDYLFTTEKSANENLRKEGISEDKIFFIGNVMIDALLMHREKAKKSLVLKQIGLDNHSVTPYAVLTLHRPSNVDQRGAFEAILEGLSGLSKILPIIFPAHPRTRRQIQELGLERYFKSDFPITSPGKGIYLLDPLGYLDFLQLMTHSKLVLTDSGGIQEETTVLGIPCLTLRDNTERPVTIEQGTNALVGNSGDSILSAAAKVLNGGIPKGRVPELWDGKAAERIIAILKDRLTSSTT